MRNRLAGVLTNVELVEMLLRDAGETLTPAQRDDMLTALGYARAASSQSSFATSLRSNRQEEGSSPSSSG